jgi:hypothetical protein
MRIAFWVIALLTLANCAYCGMYPRNLSPSCRAAVERCLDACPEDRRSPTPESLPRGDTHWYEYNDTSGDCEQRCYDLSCTKDD